MGLLGMLPTLKTPGIWVCVYSHALSYQFINSWFKKKKKKKKKTHTKEL